VRVFTKDGEVKLWVDLARISCRRATSLISKTARHDTQASPMVRFPVPGHTQAPRSFERLYETAKTRFRPLQTAPGCR
jgi:hypothetical protein